MRPRVHPLLGLDGEVAGRLCHGESRALKLLTQRLVQLSPASKVLSLGAHLAVNLEHSVVEGSSSPEIGQNRLTMCWPGG